MSRDKITRKVFTPNILEEKEIDEHRQGEAFLMHGAERPGMKQAFIETYGCQMNFSDTEIIASVLTDLGYGFTNSESNADLVLINTCSIRENAEDKVWHRLRSLRGVKRQRPGLIVGVMGCMAERLKSTLLEQEKLVDIVVGPDAYRNLPELLHEAETGQKAVNVLLSREETYADISPIRLNSNGVTAFISIMRGCDNMCSFCIVPFTRGRERSRDAESIVHEARELFEQGYREVTLLGQNVDSYSFEQSNGQTINFATLLESVASIHPDLRVRFSTSHPKDITDDVLFAMKRHENICKFIHLPAQSGATSVLERMRRSYSREWYDQKVDRIRELLPGCAISTDIISGFCGETEAEHQETLDLMRRSAYENAFMFIYSERPGTPAAKKYTDDVPEEIKKARLSQIIEIQQANALTANQRLIGTTGKVLIEGDARRSSLDFCGRMDGNQMVVFPKIEGYQPGQYAYVRITEATAATLKGEIVTP